MTQMADWSYDELRQAGLDFEDVDQVARYDEKQGSDPQEERQLLERLGIAAGQVVVDLGCGTGSFAREAARAAALVRAGFKIVERVHPAPEYAEYICTPDR